MLNLILFDAVSQKKKEKEEKMHPIPTAQRWKRWTRKGRPDASDSPFVAFGAGGLPRGGAAATA